MKLELEQESMDKTFKNLPLMEAFDICVNIHKVKLEFWLDRYIKLATTPPIIQKGCGLSADTKDGFTIDSRYW